MPNLSRKHFRTLDRALQTLFSVKGFSVVKDLQDLRVPDVLKRELVLPDRRRLLLTDAGLAAVDVIVTILAEATPFSEDAGSGDVRAALFAVLKQFFADAVMPEHGQEFVSLIWSNLSERIDDRTFVAPIFGVKLVELPALSLGTFKIVPASTQFLSAAGVEYDPKLVNLALDGVRYWLVGTVRGTERIAKERFLTHAEMITGLLAITAAAVYESGAHAFRITVAIAVQAHLRSSWLSWSKKDIWATTHVTFLGKQEFPIDSRLLNDLQDAGILTSACTFLEASKKTPLQEAVARALYWYSEAHRETVPPMKLVKYWSAVEVFFTAENAQITKALSTGLAAVVVFGGYPFIDVQDYSKTKARAAKLYGARSRAVHHGAHAHVSDQDAATLSQWAAWMLINMITLTMRGYTKLAEIKERVDTLDQMLSRAKVD